VRPVARVEGARGIDVGDPSAIDGDALDHPAHERRLPAPAGPDDLREPPARQPATRQRVVERPEPRRQPGSDRARRIEEIGELLLEGGKRHGVKQGRGKREESQMRVVSESRATGRAVPAGYVGAAGVRSRAGRSLRREAGSRKRTIYRTNTENRERGSGRMA
jgi:hypothetical protein